MQRHRRLQQLWQVLLPSTALPRHLQAAADAPSVTLCESSGRAKTSTAFEHDPLGVWPQAGQVVATLGAHLDLASREDVRALASEPACRPHHKCCLCEAVYSAKPKLRVCCACCFSASLSLRRMGRHMSLHGWCVLVWWAHMLLGIHLSGS